MRRLPVAQVDRFINLDEPAGDPHVNAGVMKRTRLVGALALILFGGCSSYSSQEHYEALEEHGRVTAEMTGQSGFCGLVQLTIDAGGMKYPLAYPLDVLERYDTEHC
jgi:hypothetical protein